jgi:hypothetical protein
MKVKKIVFLEGGLAVAFAFAFLITYFWPDWIERVFDAAPDQGSGEAEWGTAAVLGLITIVFSVLARMEWRRAALRK